MTMSERKHHLAAWVAEPPGSDRPVIIMEGTLAHPTAASVEGLLMNLWTKAGNQGVVDLTDLDIDDSEGTVALFDLLRARHSAGLPLTLIGAPQMLCHNLYRAGMLDGANAVRLIDMRQDEPFLG